MCRGCVAPPTVGGEDASADHRTREMEETSRKNMWMMLELGVMLALSGMARGTALHAPGVE
jgi:hypothetical protein